MDSSEFEEGDLVWAKLDGHPWWPSLVCFSPQGSLRKKNKFGGHIHVQFFSSPPTTAWVKDKNVNRFDGQDSDECNKGGKFYCTKKTFWASVNEADRAQFMTTEERQELIVTRPEKEMKRKSQDDSDADKGPSPTKKSKIKPNPTKSTGPHSSKIVGPKPAKTAGPKSTKATGPKSAKNSSPSPPPKKKSKIGPKSSKSAGSLSSPLKKTAATKSSSTHRSVATKSYHMGKDRVPPHWKTPFVLMNTADVPEDLTPDDFITVKTPAPKPKVKLELPDDFEDDDDDDDDEVNDVDTEDELMDSDDDPGWMPEGTVGGVSEEEAAVEEEDEHSDIHEDSDEDPGWSPGGKKKDIVPPKTKTKKFGLKKKPSKSTSKTKSPVAKTSLQHSSANQQSTAKSTSGNATSHSKAKVVSPKPSANPPTPAVNSPAGVMSKTKNFVITDNTPTGPEPEIGDFMLEKAECKDGNIPFLWRFKRGGLIQKFVKKEEDGKVFYENILSFSDWWACYAHLYQKVETQVLFKYRNVEKITITKEPTIDFTEPPGALKKGCAQPSEPEKTPVPAQKSSTSTQEQEITSTTPEVSAEVSGSDRDFPVGNFVLDMKDQRNVDNFPIWRIESNILLKKYESCVKNGKLLHKPVKTYRGYKDIVKQYIPLKTTRVLEFPGEEMVEVTEETKPKLDIDSSMAEQLEKNPLLRHFYVYMQVFLSQALEPGFLEEVLNTKDATYVEPVREINKLVKQKATNLERKVRWTDKIKAALVKSPYLREVPKSDSKKKCEAIVDSDEPSTEVVFLFGCEYNADVLKMTDTQIPSQEFKIGKTAALCISTYHQLCHFKFNLYDKCLAKIKLIREKEGETEVEKIMDACLGNKTWVLQNFEDFTKLVEIT